MSVTEASSNLRTDYEGENKSSPDDPKSKPGHQTERANPLEVKNETQNDSKGQWF